MTAYIPAVNQRPRSPGTMIRLIVVHTGETGEGSTAAEGMANWFASGNTIGSAHLCVDDNSTVRCAPDANRTNGAAGANDDGLHIELAGRAGQTAGDWNDAYSRAVLERAAVEVANWCATHGIQARKLDPHDVKAGRWGICGHHDVSQAYGLSSHWDPGPNFPWASFIARVNELLSPEEDMKPEDFDRIRTIVREEINAAADEQTGTIKTLIDRRFKTLIKRYFRKDVLTGEIDK